MKISDYIGVNKTAEVHETWNGYTVQFFEFNRLIETRFVPYTRGMSVAEDMAEDFVLNKLGFDQRKLLNE